MWFPATEKLQKTLYCCYGDRIEDFVDMNMTTIAVVDEKKDKYWSGFASFVVGSLKDR